MKRIYILIILMLGIFPVIKNSSLSFGISECLAQTDGSEDAVTICAGFSGGSVEAVPVQGGVNIVMTLCTQQYNCATHEALGPEDCVSTTTFVASPNNGLTTTTPPPPPPPDPDPQQPAQPPGNPTNPPINLSPTSPPVDPNNPCAGKTNATSVFSNSILAANNTAIRQQADQYYQQNQQYLEYGADVTVSFADPSNPYQGGFSYNNTQVTAGNTANSWSPSYDWSTNNFDIGWDHFHPGVPGESASPKDMAWFITQLGNATSAGGSAASDFFKQNSFGIVNTDQSDFYIKVSDWGKLATQVAAFHANETNFNNDYEFYVGQKGVEYGLLKSFPGSITLFEKSKNSNDFTAVTLNSNGKNVTKTPCPN